MVLRGNALTQSTRLASRAMSTQALSNPTLSNIEKRWEGMPLQEQADLWMALRDRMKGNWKELTLQEKKAGRWRAVLKFLCQNSLRKHERACRATRLVRNGGI